MKQRVAFSLILLLLTTFCGCNSDNSSLSFRQQKAVENSIKYIKKSSFSSKNRIDTSVIKIANATDVTWKSVWNSRNQNGEEEVDTSDWVITIGSASAHDFAIIVCDSQTSKVIGYIPVD